MPLTVAFLVVVPCCALPFTFGRRMMSCNQYHDLAQFVADKSGDMSSDDVMFFCDGYPDTIHDVDSYGEWLVWAMGHDVRDRVLTVRG